MTTARAQVLQQPEQPPPSRSDQRLIMEIAAVLAAYVTAKQIAGALRKSFLAIGISPAVLLAVTTLVMSQPHDVIEGTGPATRYAVRQNYVRRAAFFLNAARRAQQAVASARAEGVPVLEAIQQAIGVERRLLGQHMVASQQRIFAASAIDSAADVYGPLLSWQAVRDRRCTPECLAADGKNFTAAQPPAIGYPGMTHARCRCTPGPPVPGAPVLP